jgi:hypothetical protein
MLLAAFLEALGGVHDQSALGLLELASGIGVLGLVALHALGIENRQDLLFKINFFISGGGCWSEKGEAAETSDGKQERCLDFHDQLCLMKAENLTGRIKLVKQNE